MIQHPSRQACGSTNPPPPQFLLVGYDCWVKYELHADITHLLDAQKKSTAYLRTGMASYTVD